MEGKTISVSSEHFEEDIGEDRISKLPDNLIHEILSFIDMKFAVQTCVLSKRWKNIWMSLPFIISNSSLFLEDRDAIWDFGDSESVIRMQGRFINFMNKVFEFRDDSDIQKIDLHFKLGDALVEPFNRWILEAVNHNIKDLTIFVGCYHNCLYEIPPELLNSKSLKCLRLMAIGIPFGTYIDIILPKSIILPQIRELLLSGFSISNLEMQRLLSSCPLMKSVAIKICDIQINCQRNIMIDSRSLQALTLIDNRHTHIGPADHSLSYTTKISAPNAKDLTCRGFMRENFSLENFSSLVNAQFKMSLGVEEEEEEDETAETYSEVPTEEKEVLARRMLKFLGAVRNVQHLKLSSGFLEVLLQAPGTLYRQPLQLCNLEILRLKMRFTRGCLRSIAYLLMISPIVTTLKLKSKESNLADVGDDWEGGLPLTSMFSHLKIVEIRDVEGCDNESKFLRFLLKNSTVLEKVNLFFRSIGDSLDNERQVRRFKRSVKVLPAASSNIQMKLFKSKD